MATFRPAASASGVRCGHAGAEQFRRRIRADCRSFPLTPPWPSGATTRLAEPTSPWRAATSVRAACPQRFRRWLGAASRQCDRQAASMRARIDHSALRLPGVVEIARARRGELLARIRHRRAASSRPFRRKGLGASAGGTSGARGEAARNGGPSAASSHSASAGSLSSAASAARPHMAGGKASVSDRPAQFIGMEAACSAVSTGRDDLWRIPVEDSIRPSNRVRRPGTSARALRWQ